MGKDSSGSRSIPDTILTDSSTRVLDALCEGKIKGLINGAKGIYLNKVPIQNANGSFNFQAEGAGVAPIPGVGQSIPGLFSYAEVPGSNDQPPIPGFGAAESETAVGQEVRQATGPITISITTPDLDAVVVTLQTPRLINVAEDGRESVTGFHFKIYLKVNAGIFVLQYEEIIIEKSSGGFELQRTVNVPPASSSIQVRVERVSLDSDSDRITNSFYWKSYTKIIYEKFNYPNLALVGLTLNSKILQGSFKERRYHIDGNEVIIPSNATVQNDGSLIYTGAWNGTFTTATWCADPAWCLYDLIINNRYGVGIPENIIAMSKWDYYQASQWCNEMVSDGQGGIEPRYLLNVVIDQPGKAYQVISQLAGVFGGLFFVLGGSLTLRADQPVNPIGLLNNENAKFNYQGTALRKRYTLALVSWKNPELIGDDDFEIVEDSIGMAKYGIKEIRVKAIGCNRRSQARRFGLWYLFTNRLQANTLVATVNAMALGYEPGDVLEIADQNKEEFLIGRVRSGGSNQVELDQEILLSQTDSWTIQVTSLGQVATRNIVTSGITSNIINLTTNLPGSVDIGAAWVIKQVGTDNLPKYQILEATPERGEGWKLTMMKYDPTKWGQIDDNLLVDDAPVNNLPMITNKPINLEIYNISTFSGNSITEKTIAHWGYPRLANGSADPYTRSYLMSYRETNSNTWAEISTTDRSVELANLIPGFYWFKVIAIDVQGRQSLDISTTNSVPIGEIISFSAGWSIVNSSIFLGLV
jgi:predicted phage tail protein